MMMIHVKNVEMKKDKKNANKMLLVKVLIAQNQMMIVKVMTVKNQNVKVKIVQILIVKEMTAKIQKKNAILKK